MSSYDLASGIGYLTKPEVDAIKEIAALLPTDPICVNIGAGAGTSSIALLEAREDAMLFDVDIDPDKAVSQLIEAGYYNADRYQRITGDSKVVAWPAGVLIDYLFVDGDHTEPGIRGDIEAWRPRLRDGGYMLFHDYWPYPPDHALAGVDYWPDVRRVVDEIVNDPIVMDRDRLRIVKVTR